MGKCMFMLIAHHTHNRGLKRSSLTEVANENGRMACDHLGAILGEREIVHQATENDIIYTATYFFFFSGVYFADHIYKASTYV